MSWIAWVLLAVALGAAEFFTLTFALGLLAGAAIIAAVVAGLGGAWVLQLAAFAVAGAAGLLVVRPVVRQHLSHAPLTSEGSDALVGKRAVVIEEATAAHGLVKLSGETGSARTLDDTHVIPAGAVVDVMEIEGATAIVYPRELLP